MAVSDGSCAACLTLHQKEGALCIGHRTLCSGAAPASNFRALQFPPVNRQQPYQQFPRLQLHAHSAMRHTAVALTVLLFAAATARAAVDTGAWASAFLPAAYHLPGGCVTPHCQTDNLLGTV